MIHRILLVLAVLLTPTAASAGVFLAVDADLVDPSKGQKPSLTLVFDEALHRATLTVTQEEGPFTRSWNWAPVRSGQQVQAVWDSPPGMVGYDVSVEMVSSSGEKTTEETWLQIASASPITASIPADTVDLAARTFQLVTNHPPGTVDIEVIDDQQRTLGKSTFVVTDALPGQPVTVSWTQEAEGNIFRISATARDAFGYWAGVEIIPWSLSIPHEDVVFASGSADIPADEAPKVDAAWRQIQSAVDRYGSWVQCVLYVGGYTDTVGDGASNQGLSERRALALGRYFRSKGATFPIHYQGFGESVQAVATDDSVDMAANRRAVYLITAGSPPTGKDTPRKAWKKVP